ncbi:sugar phosphate isomerase/epimerase family protein [Tunicatimonas pelagia]|uniref:sugar phosphate isomerase/epimerase family protein n=1 Tax=Tunicatimonas pelagia TaxID=931531 RepID=UPI00266652EC|nr:TIM barrel protein [Tunicatimonas pelagia]WKN42593.1 TIM barrel protein [Tunicatimonas pelagia]
MSFLIGCSSGSQEQATEAEAVSNPNLMFADYENLKLGFTTQNFLAAMPVSLETSKQFIDYAEQQGYAWLELRDPSAELSLEESQEIAAYAQEKGIEVSYAIQKGLLDEDFWPTFEKGLQNAGVFDGPKLIRSLASLSEFASDAAKQGWTPEELNLAVQYADSAAALAKEAGLQYVIENAGEPFFGNDNAYFGVADMFAQVSEQVGWQFDTANPFSVARVHGTVDSVRNYLRENVDNLFYIHLKSAENGQAQEVLGENPLPLPEVLQLLSEQSVSYVAIELQAVDNKEQAFANQEQSLDYLRAQGIVKGS